GRREPPLPAVAPGPEEARQRRPPRRLHRGPKAADRGRLRARGRAARRRGLADHPQRDRAPLPRAAIRGRARGGDGRRVRAHQAGLDPRGAQTPRRAGAAPPAEWGPQPLPAHPARVHGSDRRWARMGSLAPAWLHGGPARLDTVRRWLVWRRLGRRRLRRRWGLWRRWRRWRWVFGRRRELR